MSVVESDAECAQRRLVRPASRAIGPTASVAAALTGGLWRAAAGRGRAPAQPTDRGFGQGGVRVAARDAVIPHPMVEWTRGVTVHTTRSGSGPGWCR